MRKPEKLDLLYVHDMPYEEIKSYNGGGIHFGGVPAFMFSGCFVALAIGFTVVTLVERFKKIR